MESERTWTRSSTEDLCPYFLLEVHVISNGPSQRTSAYVLFVKRTGDFRLHFLFKVYGISEEMDQELHRGLCKEMDQNIHRGLLLMSLITNVWNH